MQYYPIRSDEERAYNMIIVRKKKQILQRKSYDECDKKMLFGLEKQKERRDREQTNRN